MSTRQVNTPGWASPMFDETVAQFDAVAELMGLDDRIGSIEVGKQATFLITTGTPIDMTSDIE